MNYNIKQVLIKRDGMTSQEADEEIKQLRQRVWDGENPEEICKCGTTVHPVRINLGYKTCVQCSTTKTYSYVPIIEHKTGNTIQIVSQEVSASVHRAWRRK